MKKAGRFPNTMLVHTVLFNFLLVCRLLLSLCKAAHQFSMAVAPRLSEVKREEEVRREEERQRWECDQRISVISSTSSNTTSGIVSDRVHSEDELEIMITR